MSSINPTGISGSLASMFQTAYTNSLLQKDSLGTSSSLVSLALNTPTPGSNPLNPLQGVSAISGLGSFITQVQQTAALRKAGLLPPVGSAAALQNNQNISSIIGALTSLGGLGGVGAGTDPLLALLGGLGGAGAAGAGADPLLALLGADAAGQSALGPNPATTAALATAANPVAADTVVSAGNAGNAAGVLGAAVAAPANPSDAQLAAQLQSMLSMLQSLLGGTGASASPFAGLLGGAPGATPGLTGQQVLFPQTVNFTVIDNAINQALGGIFNTLPLVKI
jgi:hypothetical protein